MLPTASLCSAVVCTIEVIADQHSSYTCSVLIAIALLFKSKRVSTQMNTAVYLESGVVPMHILQPETYSVLCDGYRKTVQVAL